MNIDFSQIIKKSDTEAMLARAWRDAELQRADIILNRIQDGESKLGSQKSWRLYRVELRAYPDKDGFPSVESRPIAPDAA